MRVLSCVGLLVLLAADVIGHGRLIGPPSRSSAWRFGFNNPPNFNDNELFCGGYNHQWQTNNGSCGVCGDDYSKPQPRDNEAGGKYGNGIIVGHYNVNDVMAVTVDLTTHHKGYFEFRLCVNNNVKKIITHECLDENLLTLAENGETRYYLPEGSSSGVYTLNLRLPTGLSCSQCVLQWKYNTGNTWGKDPDGTSCTGCGPQEQFYGCADISVGEGSGPVATKTSTSAPPTTSTQAPTTSTAEKTTTTQQPTAPPGGSNCHAIGDWLGNPNMDQWCRENCAVGNCPATHCRCEASAPTEI